MFHWDFKKVCQFRCHNVMSVEDFAMDSEIKNIWATIYFHIFMFSELKKSNMKYKCIKYVINHFQELICHTAQ